jgi:hypothetical protein
MGYYKFMLDSDYQKHNEAAAALLEAEKAGSHPRVPMKISANPRMILSDPLRNPEKIEFKTDMEDPGFPVRFGELLRRLGPETAVSGGVHVDILLKGGREAVRADFGGGKTLGPPFYHQRG